MGKDCKKGFLRAFVVSVLLVWRTTSVGRIWFHVLYMPGSRIQDLYLTVEVGYQMIYKLELVMRSLLSRTFSIQYYVKKC